MYEWGSSSSRKLRGGGRGDKKDTIGEVNDGWERNGKRRNRGRGPKTFSSLLTVVPW